MKIKSDRQFIFGILVKIIKRIFNRRDRKKEER